MKKVLLALSFFSFAFAISATPFFTQEVFANTQEASKDAPAISLGYSLKPRKQFVLTAKNVKKVSYIIQYTRTAGGKDMLEGLQGGGKSKKNVFTGVHFAGTQSSKYFIPHNIKSGSINLTGTNLQGKKFSYKASFVMKGNKLVITSKQ